MNGSEPFTRSATSASMFCEVHTFASFSTGGDWLAQSHDFSSSLAVISRNGEQRVMDHGFFAGVEGQALVLREPSELLGLIEIAETRNAMSKRADDLVVLRLEIIRAAKVALCADRIVERNVHQMAEVVMIPRGLRREVRCLAIRPHRDAIVPEKRVAEAHERVKDVVFGAVREYPPQVQRRLPGVVLKMKLSEVTVSEK